MSINTRLTRRLALVGCAGAFAVVASGSALATTTPDDAAGGDSSDPAAAAAARVAPFLEPATSIGIETPIDGEIPTDISVVWLEGNIPSIAPITTGIEAATEALGWDLTTLTYDSADPQSPGSAMQQAVDGGADFIISSGIPAEILGTGLEAAIEAGIPVINMYVPDEVGGAENGIYANIGGPANSQASYPLLADMIIADSGGTATTLVVSLPDYAILNVATDAIDAQFESQCPDCTVQSLDVSVTDMMGGTVGSQIVSSIQANPDIGYVLVVIGDLATGLPATLEGADLGAVKLVGHVPNVEQLQSLADGTSFAWIPLPRPESGWAAVDAAVRLSVGQDVEQDAVAVLPIEVWTTDNVPQPVAEYEGPAGYQDMFLALWGLA